MGWREGFAALAVTGMALAACSKPADKGTTAATGEAKTAAATAPAAPMTPPHRRAGLWEQTVTTSGMTQTSRLCLDDAVEKEMAWWGGQAGRSTCQQTSVKPIMGGWSFSSVCDLGQGGKVHSEGQATGDWNSHYVVDAKSTTEGSAAPQMNGEHQMKLEATWKGPCPADMKPGDMELGNGMKINMMDMTARAKGAMSRHSTP